jgi:DnaJ domain
MPASPSAKSFSGSDRPECMVVLGLLPPYSAEDVKHAYLAKVKEYHPDHDGTRADFDKLQEAYEQAQVYVIFRGDRRGWIARRVEEYLATEEVIRRLKELGAEVETRAVEWLEKSFGDFAELTESIIGVRLTGADNGDEFLHYIVGQHDHMLELRRVEIPSCNVTDGAVLQLSVFRRLAHLNLSNTPITGNALQVIRWLPELESINLEATSISWWTRRKLKAMMRKKSKLAVSNKVVHPTKLR